LLLLFFLKAKNGNLITYSTSVNKTLAEFHDSLIWIR